MISSSSDRMQTAEQPSKYLFRFDKDIKFDSAKESDKLLTIKLLTINGEYNFISRELIQDFLIRNIKTIASTTINLSELQKNNRKILEIYCIQGMVNNFTRIKNSFEEIGSAILANIETISDEQSKSDINIIYNYFFSDNNLKVINTYFLNAEGFKGINYNDALIENLRRFKQALVLFLIIVNNTINSNKDKYKCSQCDKKNFTLEIYKHNFNSSTKNKDCTLKTYHSSSYSTANCYMIGFFDLYNIQFNRFDGTNRNIIIIKQKERIDIPDINDSTNYNKYNKDTPSTTLYALHKVNYAEYTAETTDTRGTTETSTKQVDSSLITTHEYILTNNELIPIIKLSFNDGNKDYDILNYILEQLSSTIRTEYSFLQSDIATGYIETNIPDEFKKIFLDTYTTPSIEADCKCKNICIKFSDDISKKQLSFQNIKDIMKHIEENITNITKDSIKNFIETIPVSTRDDICDDDCDDDCDNGKPASKKRRIYNKYYINKYIKYKMKYINLKNELDLSNHF